MRATPRSRASVSSARIGPATGGWVDALLEAPGPAGRVRPTEGELALRDGQEVGRLVVEGDDGTRLSRLGGRNESKVLPLGIGRTAGPPGT